MFISDCIDQHLNVIQNRFMERSESLMMFGVMFQQTHSLFCLNNGVPGYWRKF